MTDEEKKEFEEFLEWKRQKAARQQAEKETALTPEAKGESAIDLEKVEQIKQEPEAVGTEKQDNNFLWITIILVALIFLFMIAFLLGNNQKTAQPSLEEECDSALVEEILDDSSEAEETVPTPSIVTWTISTEMDEMTDTRNIWGVITSDDYICQDFPYEGLTYASITARYMKKYGYDVIVKITKGQIDGREYYGTNYITARFDGGTPKKYYYNESADGSPNVVFIRQSSDFIKKCKTAKDIKIDIPVYQSGRPVFTFHVDEPLVWPSE